MPPKTDNFWEELERLVHRDPAARGLASYRPGGRFLDAGQLAAAAQHLAKHARHVAIVTGFAVLAEPHPVAETDGPPGALYLARVLRALDTDVSFVSDQYGLPLLNVGCDMLGLPRSAIVEMPMADVTGQWVEAYFARNATLTHMIAIERVGPSHTRDSLVAQARDAAPPLEQFERECPMPERNVCHSMRGTNLDAITAPTQGLFDHVKARGLPITTIGIGDGGNEIGLGSFAWEVLQPAIPGDNAGRILCRVATDYTLLAGVSNWAAYALAAAVCRLRGRTELLREWPAVKQGTLIEALVRDAGAIDGLTRRHEPTVDGLPLATYLDVLSNVVAICDPQGKD